VSDDISVERGAGVVTVTIDRPRTKNALTRAMITELTAAVRSADEDQDARVIVLRSSGPDFCTGIDLRESNDPKRTGGARPKVGHLQRGFPYAAHGLIQAMHIVQCPVVASVRGWAAGIGNAVALSADVVVADTSARFWVPMVSRGFTPDSGNSWLLPRLIGVARAKEMLLRGRPIGGEQAAAWGLISACVTPEQLDAEVDGVVRDLAQAATVAVGLTRQLVHRNLTVDLDAALQNEGVYEEIAVRSDDFKEGIRSFTERRPPDFQGR
jgi:2-(1,2-epoxy-1,2-dihydrophenyl)acetyl-CoA isomerase